MGLTKSSSGRQLKKSNATACGGFDVRIAIAGNPNVGKSTVFNALTGMDQHTGNWSGKTVEMAEGFFSLGDKRISCVDIPGTYSLITRSPEEEVARGIIEDPRTDAIIVVCDATCLERNLPLALQILEMNKPTLICVNLLDEAKRRGISIDLDALSSRLGTPTSGTVARKKGGLKDLLDGIEALIASPNGKPSGIITGKNILSDCEKAMLYVSLSEQICSNVCKRKIKDSDGRDRLLDKLFVGKKTAYPIMMFFLALIFWLTVVGANYPSRLLSDMLFYIGDQFNGLLTLISCPIKLKSLLVDGIYRTLAWIVSVMLPPMAIFFPLFTILEDFGYLPRIAFNLDRPFQKCKSCGKQALTMCMGFGCNAAGVIGCRIIDSPRERMIAVLTNSFVPCNGRFPLLITLITVFFVGSAAGVSAPFVSALILTLFIILGILMTFFISKLLSSTLLRGAPSSFTLELPPYRAPQFGKVIIRSMLDRTVFVLGRAVISAIPAGIVIWCLANIYAGDSSLLILCANFLDPMASLIGLDGVILMAFILALPANEIVIPIIIMTYISASSLTDANDIAALKAIFIDNGWTVKTAICTILFSLFHWPCATTLMTVKKECGSLKWTAAAAIIPTLCGIILCATVNLIFIIFAQ